MFMPLETSVGSRCLSILTSVQSCGSLLIHIIRDLRSLFSYYRLFNSATLRVRVHGIEFSWLMDFVLHDLI
jgi:hypothetical protein